MTTSRDSLTPISRKHIGEPLTTRASTFEEWHMMSDESDAHIWPEDLLDASAVRVWIASALPGAPTVAGPERVYQAKEWGVTARFTVNRAQLDTRESVIFKAILPPLFAHAPHVYALLTRHCPNATPELLAWSPTDAGAWLLFAPFTGVSASVLPGMEPLLAMARALAAIQITIAALPASETAMIPRVHPRDFPVMFDAVLADIRARHLAFWRGEGRDLAEQFALPDNLDERLARFRPRLAGWAAELEAGGWPLTLDHVDLQPDNAVLQPDGRMLLFDWEEANLSLPFFSLDRLLDDAQECGGDASEAALCAAYLDALPWATRGARERALTLALCFAPLKHAYEGLRLADALGWEEGLPHVTAWAAARMLRRWEATL